MKNFLTLLVIAFSLTVNSQNNLTIKGKFLNFKEFESLNYYHITCNVYNPLSSFSKHSFVMFDKNGEFVNMRSMRPWVKIDGKYKLNYELLNTILFCTLNKFER